MKNFEEPKELKIIPDLTFVVDMQNDFTKEGGTLFSASSKEVIPKTKEFLDTLVFEKIANQSIIFTRDTHGADYLETREGWYLPVKHTLKGSGGWALVDELNSFTLEHKEKTTVWNKDQFAMDTGDILDAYFDIKSQKKPNTQKALPNHEEAMTIAICGVLTDICVVTNALLLRSLFPNDVIVVFGDYCAGSTEEKHEDTLSVMRSCQIEVVSNPFDAD